MKSKRQSETQATLGTSGKEEKDKETNKSHGVIIKFYSLKHTYVSFICRKHNFVLFLFAGCRE